MKRKLLIFALALSASAGTGFADSGIFGLGIELQGSGAAATNNGVVTLYNFDSDSRLLPTGSSATLSTSWTSASNATTPSFNLGTFSATDTLELLGGSLLTFKNGGSNVNGSTLEYQIFPSAGPSGSFTAVGLGFNQDNVNGNGGDQRWANESLTTNLLTGLAPGTYTLDVYGLATTDSDGNKYDNGTGLNYGATFTVLAAPEPGTWAMMLGGLGILVALQRFRRKSSV